MSDISDRNPPDKNHYYKKHRQQEAITTTTKTPTTGGSTVGNSSGNEGNRGRNDNIESCQRSDASASFERCDVIQPPESLEVLVTRMGPLIRYTAKRLKVQSCLPMHVDIDDLIQAGTVGLIEARQRYDPHQGATFETFAIKRIQGAMLDELRASDWLPRSIRRHAREAERVHSRLEQSYGCSIRERDVAAVMQVPLNTYNCHRNDVHNSQLLDYTDYDLETFLPEEEVEPLTRMLSDELHGLLQLAIASLDDDREREALVSYRLNGCSLRTIGGRMKVSESRVCQLHKRAMKKIRSWFRQYFPELDYTEVHGHFELFPAPETDASTDFRYPLLREEQLHEERLRERRLREQLRKRDVERRKSLQSGVGPSGE